MELWVKGTLGYPPPVIPIFFAVRFRSCWGEGAL